MRHALASAPKVFIIVLNWNSTDDTLACIGSLHELNYPNFNIIVVDNGSDPDPRKILEARYPTISFIQTGSNLGYAGGNNVGIKVAVAEGADYVWLLNNDTVVHPDALHYLVETALSDDSIGMVGSKIMFAADVDVLWYAGASFALEKGGTTLHYGWGQKDSGQYDHITDVGYVTGCSLLVRKSVIEIVGLIPEEYFLYFEETDWNYATQKAGFRTVLAPKSVVWHKVKTKQDVQERLVYYMTRNRFLLVKKLDPKYLKQCIHFQFLEGKHLIKSLLLEKRYIESLVFLRILLLAWFHGLVCRRTGKTW